MNEEAMVTLAALSARKTLQLGKMFDCYHVDTSFIQLVWTHGCWTCQEHVLFGKYQIIDVRRSQLILNSRHDLNPAEPTPEETAPEAGATVEPSPPVAAETPVFVDPAARNRRRVSRFFELNRLRNAPPDERIAALRALREEGQSDTTTAPQVTEEPSRRRLRDRLHMGSRSNEAPIVASPTVSSSTPSAASTSETPRRT